MGAPHEELLQLDRSADPRFGFTDVPAALTNARNYGRWSKQLKDFLYREKVVTVLKCADLKQYSMPDEAEDDFRIRLTQIAKEKRDLMVEKLRKRYASKISTLTDRIRRANEKVQREKTQYRTQAFQSAISFGTSVLGALMGRKLTSVTNVGRAGTAMRSAGRTAQQHSDIGRAEEAAEALREKLEQLEEEAQEEIDRIKESIRADEMELESLEIRPRKSDIQIKSLALVWTPWSVDSHGIAERLF